MPPRNFSVPARECSWGQEPKITLFWYQTGDVQAGKEIKSGLARDGSGYYYDSIEMDNWIYMVSKTNQTSSNPVTISYRYDRLGRLTEEDYSGWKRSFYEYDACSNRTKMMVEGKSKDDLVSVTSYDYGLNNRLEKEVRMIRKSPINIGAMVCVIVVRCRD